MEKIESSETQSDKPVKTVKIAKSGELEVPLKVSTWNSRFLLHQFIRANFLPSSFIPFLHRQIAKRRGWGHVLGRSELLRDEAMTWGMI